MMLYRYRFDLTNASDEDKLRVRKQIDHEGFTGEIIVSQSVFDAFLDENQDVETLISLPRGCTVTKLS